MDSIVDFEHLQEFYQGRVAAWIVERGESERPSFWELEFDTSILDFQSLSKSLVTQIDGHSVVYSSAIAAYLFAILRAEVSGFHGGKLWPEVARVISRYSGHPLNGAELGSFFRSILHREFATQLRDVHGNKYLAICFDQAGVGTERTRLIKAFFRYLIDKHQVSGDTGRSFVISALEKFERSNSNSHIDKLHIVLERSGVVLLHLASLFERGLVASLLMEWDWDLLRAEYKRHSGFDLVRLMPEAQEAFEEIFPSLRRLIRRDELEQVVRQGRFSIQLPDGRLPKPLGSRRYIPLGYVLLKKAGYEKPVEVLDECGLRGEAYESFKLNQWTILDGHSFYTSGEPFQVIINGYQRSNSFPIFIGQDFHGQVLSIYGWSNSGFLGAAQLEVAASGNRIGAVSATLRVFTQWRLIEGVICCRITGFKSSFLGHYSGLELLYHGRLLWAGGISSSGGSLDEKLDFDLPLVKGIEERPEIQLWSDELEAVIAATCIPPLSASKYFLIDGQQIFLPRQAKKLRSSSCVLLAVPEEVSVLSCTKARLEHATSSAKFTGMNLFEVTAEDIDLSETHIHLSDGSHCLFGLSPDFISPPPFLGEFDGIQISTRGNVIVCNELEKLEVSISNCYSVESLSMRLSFDDEEIYCAGPELEAILVKDRRIDGLVHIAPGSLFLEKNLAIHAGVWKLELVHLDSIH